VHLCLLSFRRWVSFLILFLMHLCNIHSRFRNGFCFFILFLLHLCVILSFRRWVLFSIFFFVHYTLYRFGNGFCFFILYSLHLYVILSFCRSVSFLILFLVHLCTILSRFEDGFCILSCFTSISLVFLLNPGCEIWSLVGDIWI